MNFNKDRCRALHSNRKKIIKTLNIEYRDGGELYWQQYAQKGSGCFARSQTGQICKKKKSALGGGEFSFAVNVQMGGMANF